MPGGAAGQVRRGITLQALRAALRSPTPLAALRELAFPPPLPPVAPLPQLALWVVDAEGLPPRPWRIYADDVFDCRALNCRGMVARVCVVRQQVTDMQRTEQASRGQGTDFPSCDSRKCAQGRGIREALDPRANVAWRGAGPGKRFQPSRRDVESLAAARARKRAVGLLDRAPTIDAPSEAVEGEG